MKKCGYFADLEMISFWLLCLKVLRATTGVKRTNGGKLSEGCSHPQNPTAEDQEYFSGAVTIETSHLPGTATVTDNKMDSMETEMAENNGSLAEGEKVGIQADITQPVMTEESVEPSEVPTQDRDEITVLQDLENGDQESGRDISCHKEALVLEAGQEEFRRTEIMTSPVSNSPSNTGSVKEHKLACKSQHLIDQRDTPIPTDEKISSIPTEEKHSLIHTEKRDTPIPDEEKDGPKLKEKDKPLPSEEKDIPITKEEEDTNMPNEEKDRPVPNEEKDSRIPTEKRDSPIAKEEKDSRIPTKKMDSPIAKEEKDSRIPTEKRDSPIAKEEKDSRIPTEKRDSPIAKEEKDSRIPTKKMDSPIAKEEKDSRIPTEKEDSPIAKEEMDSRIPTEKRDSPIAKEEKDSHIPTEKRDSPIAKEKSNSPIPKDNAIATEENNNPISKEERDNPIPKEEINSLVLTGDAECNVVPEDSLKAQDDHEAHDVTQDNATQREKEEPVLQKCLKEDNLSDVSNESCHNLDQDDLSDCLQVEIAIVSSDSESDDKWQAIFSSSINKEEENDAYLDNSKDANAQEHFVQEVANTEDALTDPDQKTEAQFQDSASILEQPESNTGYDLETQEDPCLFSTQFHGSSKISEDKEDVAPSLVKHRTYTINSMRSTTDKKIPSDYCVIQETKSENVSTEHVDFRVARKQWLKIEEQTKQQALQPVVKQGTCQGGHNLMYTPVRNIEKAKKDIELDSLALRELTFTQFSPCSEDSGLDDCSYRSPYDEPETPIEREIRLAMEREENLRRERGLPSSPCANVRPATLFMGKFNKPEERRKTSDLQEDSCRPLRSPSAKTPPFSVSTSSSLKSPTYHEMAANNVIILEPDPCGPNAKHCPHGPQISPGLKTFSEWPSDTTNVIILETSNLIIRSASEFCLNTISQDTQESTFLNNPFFKLRSRSTQSLVDREIKIVKQRDEELKRQRAHLYPKEKYETVLVSPNLMESINFDKSAELPVRCKSSPSSPLKTARKMDRSIMSCDHKFMDTFSGVRRKSAMAVRWEAGEFTNHQQE